MFCEPYNFSVVPDFILLPWSTAKVIGIHKIVLATVCQNKWSWLDTIIKSSVSESQVLSYYWLIRSSVCFQCVISCFSSVWKSEVSSESPKLCDHLCVLLHRRTHSGNSYFNCSFSEGIHLKKYFFYHFFFVSFSPKARAQIEMTEHSRLNLTQPLLQLSNFGAFYIAAAT